MINHSGSNSDTSDVTRVMSGRQSPVWAEAKGEVMVNNTVKTPTPTQHNTTVGFDMKMTVQTTPPHRNFSATSRPARELKFGTDIH